MADDEHRSFDPARSAANRAQQQGLGAGQRDMDEQRAPSRERGATSADRTEPFDPDFQAGGDGGDRPSEAEFAQDAEAREQPIRRDAWGLDPNLGRDEAGMEHAGDLGAGTPANVDIHKLGQEDKPEEDWGEAAGEGAMHSSNHSRRGVKTDAERGQGRLTRARNKDIMSNRG